MYYTFLETCRYNGALKTPLYRPKYFWAPLNMPTVSLIPTNKKNLISLVEKEVKNQPTLQLLSYTVVWGCNTNLECEIMESLYQHNITMLTFI